MYFFIYSSYFYYSIRYNFNSSLDISNLSFIDIQSSSVISSFNQKCKYLTQCCIKILPIATHFTEICLCLSFSCLKLANENDNFLSKKIY